MASPRVFISSTCYDLGEIRDGLFAFISSYGYEPILSEKGDVFYHPDMHTQESCIQEMDNCQILVLIIGGRFGGHYVADRKKSVVNAEYLAARECGISVFCFVKSEVLEDHRLYEKNKGDEELIKKIEFPSIEHKEYASDIFEFINEVRNSPVNNGLFAFNYGRDIQDLLKRQWAGMMFDFLLKRKQRSELEIATGLIGNLTLASKKTEELLESIYKHLDTEKAEESIADIDKEIEAKKFFQELLKYFHVEGFQKASLDEILEIESEVPWQEFLQNTGEFYIQEMGVADSDRRIEGICHNASNYIIDVGGQMTSSDKTRYQKFADMFEAFKNLRKEQKRKVLSDFVKVK